VPRNGVRALKSRRKETFTIQFRSVLQSRAFDHGTDDFPSCLFAMKPKVMLEVDYRDRANFVMRK
jgi:hypothetical protein